MLFEQSLTMDLRKSTTTLSLQEYQLPSLFYFTKHTQTTYIILESVGLPKINKQIHPPKRITTVSYHALSLASSLPEI